LALPFLPALRRRRSKRKQSSQLRFGAIGLWILTIIALGVVGTLGWQFVSRMWVNPPVSSTRERTDMLVKAGEHIQLTVMNGSGAEGAARTYTDFLRARKFDVIEMTNFTHQDVKVTYIIDKVNDPVAAKKVAYALGISDERIVTEPDSNAFVDAAVVIGKDFKATNPMR
jgi:hypothetical protein